MVSLSSLARSVGIVSALAAAICYQIFYGVSDLLTMLILVVPASIVGVIVGWLASMRFRAGGRNGTTTVVKHGSDGLPVTLRTALGVAAVIAIVFILIAKLALGFNGNLIGLAATIALPAILVATVLALLGSLA